MTREQARNNFEAIAHWKEGGNLWYRDEYSDCWTKWEDTDKLTFDSLNHQLSYVIEDEFFEEQKAYAIGETIQILNRRGDTPKTNVWNDVPYPAWNRNCEYRVKPIDIEFKIGDWVINTTQEDPVPYIFPNVKITPQHSHIKLWEPASLEWIVCWEEDDKYPEMNKNIEQLNYVIQKFDYIDDIGNTVTTLGSSWNHMAPISALDNLLKG